MLMLDGDGNVYGLGSNKYGQLGVESEHGYVEWVTVAVRLVKLSKEYIVGLAAGDRCSLYLDRKGQVYSSGQVSAIDNLEQISNI